MIRSKKRVKKYPSRKELCKMFIQIFNENDFFCTKISLSDFLKTREIPDLVRCYFVKKETAEKFLLSVETYPDGTSKDGGGYQIHLTSTTNTDGCLGIHDDQLMNQLIDFYCKNEEKEPGTAKLKVKNK